MLTSSSYGNFYRGASGNYLYRDPNDGKYFLIEPSDSTLEVSCYPGNELEFEKSDSPVWLERGGPSTFASVFGYGRRIVKKEV